MAKQKIKQVYFGEIDTEYLEFADSLPNFSTWVKRQIQRELFGNTEQFRSKLEEKRSKLEVNTDNIGQFI